MPPSQKSPNNRNAKPTPPADALCAHPDGCTLADGLPRRAVARWKGETPYCGPHYGRARRNGGDPGPAGLKRAVCAPAPCCICGEDFYRGYKGRPYCSTHFSRASKSHDDDPGPVERMRRKGRPCSRCGGEFRRYIADEPFCEPCSQTRRYELHRDAQKERST